MFVVTDRVVDQYMETALWLSGDPPLDRDFDIGYFTDEARQQATDELQAFFDRLNDVVAPMERASGDDTGRDFDETQLAHDFWLARNGAGGFSDREALYGKELAKIFQGVAKRFGEQHVEVFERARDDGPVTDPDDTAFFLEFM